MKEKTRTRALDYQLAASIWRVKPVFMVVTCFRFWFILDSSSGWSTQTGFYIWARNKKYILKFLQKRIVF